MTLTYEDSIVAKLRRMTSPRSFPANTLSRAQIARRLADEAGIKIDTDPGHKENVHSVIERSSRGEEKTNSWDLLGSDIADPIQWRRFSDGKHLVVGSDDWLFKRSTATRVEENRGPYGYVDFDLDVGRRVSEATLTVDAHLWSLSPGAPVKLSDLGPADGNWLVAEFAADLVSSRGTVKLIRKRHELKEPPPVSTKGERGEDDFLPGKGEGTDAGGSTGSAARDRMVNWALAQKGQPYVWGASGPGAFDCSGLVQEACRAAGKVLPKPSASQWAAVVNAGRTMSVASAINTRGALLFRIGTGTYNHVVISLGNGQTIEAMGSAYGVCIGGTAGRGWTGAGTWV